MQQIIPLRGQLTNGTAAVTVTSASLGLANRRTCKVDRVQASVRAVCKNDGTYPSIDAVKAFERMVRIKLSLDQNLTQLLAVDYVPVSSFQSENMGAMPVVPFMLKDNQQFTVSWQIDTSVFPSMDVVVNSAALWLEIGLWANDSVA